MQTGKKVGIFNHEDLETGAWYYSASSADMDSSSVVDVFFVVTDGRFA
jgi:hypothetical protein